MPPLPLPRPSEPLHLQGRTCGGGKHKNAQVPGGWVRTCGVIMAHAPLMPLHQVASNTFSNSAQLPPHPPTVAVLSPPPCTCKGGGVRGTQGAAAAAAAARSRGGAVMYARKGLYKSWQGTAAQQYCPHAVLLGRGALRNL